MTIGPMPGDFACVPVGGDVGRLIRIGEIANGDEFAEYQHAFVYIGGGLVVEAEPGGARTRKINVLKTEGALWSTGLWPPVTATDAQRYRICVAARRYIGTPYSFLDYLALGLHRLRVPAPGLKAYVADTGHMICSQLVDQCYLDADIHLFDDGRWPGYVTPAALAGLIE